MFFTSVFFAVSLLALREMVSRKERQVFRKDRREIIINFVLINQ